MDIDKSLYELVNILIASKKHKTISKLAQKINKSRKVVYYNIDKLNILLEKNGENRIETVAKLGILLTENQKNIIKVLIKDNIYILSKEERELAISLLIFTHPNKYTLESITNIFEVSKNSILSNLKNINAKIKKFNKGLKITALVRGGYKVNGTELAQIQYLYILIKDIIKLKNYKFINFIQAMYADVNIVFKDEFIEDLIASIYELQIKLGKFLEAREIDNFVFSFPYLYMFTHKNKENAIEKELKVLNERLEYKILVEMFEKLNIKYDISIKEKTKLLFTLILLCTNKKTDIHNISQDFIKQRNEAENIVNNFIAQTKEQIENKKELMDEIVTFLKVLTFKKRYNIISNDIDYLKIKKENKELFDSIKNITKISDFDFTEYDISNILIYFKTYICLKKKKILIVTDETYAIKNMIKSIVLQYIKNIEIIDVISNTRYKEYENKNIDYIISTDESIAYNIETIYISSTLSKEDIAKIFTYLNN